MPSVERYEFTVTDNGKEYACERVVAGSRVQTQRITVRGVGSKDDSANYGRRGHPTITMESVASTSRR